ncbi:MAG: hypothetical protein ACPL6D_11770 [Thermodesulfobacteriota bacterium]
MCKKDIFYLIKNNNGFEEIIKSGGKKELENLKSSLIKNKSDSEISGHISYYIVTKEEWDLENCPLYPVDFP